MADGYRGARGGGPVSRELRAGLRRERHRSGLPRGSRGTGSVTDLLSLTPDAARGGLAAWLAARAEPGYRLAQILPRLWQRPVGSWEEATDLPAALRAQLGDAFPLTRLSCDAAQQSSDGTEKFLWKLADGEAVESVLIPEDRKSTRLNSSHRTISYAVFCLKKKKKTTQTHITK